jgi:CRP-like cAMP-binding protein
VENAREKLDQNQADRFREAQVVDWTGTDFRPDLAFPKLTEEMVERLKPYGHEETFPAHETLYTYGDRHIDMFVILEGGVDIFLPESNPGRRSTGNIARLTLRENSIFLAPSGLSSRRAPAARVDC